MGVWDTVKGWGQTAVNAVGGAGSDFIDYFFNNPADAQKRGLNDLSRQWQQAGQNQRDWYATQGQGIQDYFNQAGTDIDTLRNSDPTGRLKEQYTEATKGYNAPTQQQDFYNKMATDPTFRPTEQQDYYNYLNGSRDALTDSEQLYNERKGGNDPAAAYQDQRALEQINRQLAARGGYANTNGERQIGDYFANANAQRSEQLAALAQQADTTRLGKNSALGNAAQGASTETSTYTTGLGNAAAGASKEEADFNQYKSQLAKDIGDQNEKHLEDIINSDQALAGKKADIAAKITELGGQAMSDAQKEAFAAQLAALGVDPQKVKDILGLLGGVVNTGAKVASA